MREVRTPIGQVLQLLRMIQENGGGAKGTPSLAGILPSVLNVPLDSAAFHRCLAAFLDAIQEAQRDVLMEPRFDEHDRAGLLQTLTQLRAALSSQGLNSNHKTHLVNLESSISQFGLVAKLMHSPVVLAGEAEQALHDIVQDIDRIIEGLRGAAIEDRAKKALISNLSAMRLFLTNTDLFGFDAANAMYVHLFGVIQREIRRADEPTSDKLTTIVAKMKVWGEGLAVVNGAVQAAAGIATVGANLLKAVTGPQS